MNLLNRFTLTKFIPFKLLFTRKNRINFIRSNLVRFQHNSIENRAKNDFKSSVCVQNLGEICVIRLNRGHCRNALDRLAIEQLIEAFKLFNNHPQFKVGVLCGSEGNLSIGLDWRDFTQEEQLDKINDLFDYLPTRKPLIAAIEGYATCLAFQMACLCDLRVAEVDSLLGMHEAGAPIHPKVQTVFRYYRLSPEILNDLIEHKKSISVQQAHRSTWLNELTRVGCARGRSIELAKSLTKFPQSALLMDRGHIWKSVLEHHDTSSLQLDLIPEDQLWSEMKRGADRFLIDKIGRHASSKLHTLQEIYDSIRPNVFDESRLMTDLKSKRGK